MFVTREISNGFLFNRVYNLDLNLGTSGARGSALERLVGPNYVVSLRYRMNTAYVFSTCFCFFESIDVSTENAVVCLVSLPLKEWAAALPRHATKAMRFAS